MYGSCEFIFAAPPSQRFIDPGPPKFSSFYGKGLLPPSSKDPLQEATFITLFATFVSSFPSPFTPLSSDVSFSKHFPPGAPHLLHQLTSSL
ncbi:hypothetical protein M8J75_013988 [Diaphorina citri]|nr:hypothetical protein M8J75_013988 [Diaphorina citri]